MLISSFVYSRILLSSSQCSLLKSKISCFSSQFDHLVISLDDDDEKDIKLNKREKIEREREFLEKRKTKKKLSQNINIKKSRDRLSHFSSLKKELKLRENANRSTICQDRQLDRMKLLSN
jgi:hypothetical protein